jgi:hypothetical protein
MRRCGDVYDADLNDSRQVLDALLAAQLLRHASPGHLEVASSWREGVQRTFTPSVYLLVAPGQDLEITPLWNAPECDNCLHQEICYLKRVRRDESEYVSVTTNHVFRERSLPEDFPGLAQESAASTAVSTRAGAHDVGTAKEASAGASGRGPHEPHRPVPATQSSMLRTLQADVNTGCCQRRTKIDLFSTVEY